MTTKIKRKKSAIKFSIEYKNTKYCMSMNRGLTEGTIIDIYSKLQNLRTISVDAFWNEVTFDYELFTTVEGSSIVKILDTKNIKSEEAN